MKKSPKIIIGIILLIIILITSFFTLKYKARQPENSKICCNNTCFNIEIANTDAARQMGLMYRESMSNNNGMLFVFDKAGTHSFRMKNTLIPLAGIRLDSDLNIVDIILMDPCKTKECPLYKPHFEAKYVLEINQGLISEKGLLHTGDKCELIKS